MTVLADVSTFLGHIGVGATTVGAYSSTITPTLLGDSSLADALSVEVICNLKW